VRAVQGDIPFKVVKEAPWEIRANVDTIFKDSLVKRIGGTTEIFNTVMILHSLFNRQAILAFDSKSVLRYIDGEFITLKDTKSEKYSQWSLQVHTFQI
jgi:hypothetical protein